MQNFTTVKEYLIYTKDMTPEEVAREIYGVNYSDIIAHTMQIPKPTRESKEQIEDKILSYLFEQNKKIVEQINRDNAMDVDGGVFKGGDGKGIFQKGVSREVQQWDEKTWDFTQSQKKEIEIIKGDQKEKILLISNIIKDGDTDYPYIAIELPASYSQIPQKDLYIGKQFADHKDDWTFNVDYNREAPIKKEFLFFAERSRRPEEVEGHNDGINLWNNDDTDIIRETLKQGMKPMMMQDTMLMGELIRDILGDEYVNFNGYKADSDESDYEEIRKKYQEIDEVFSTRFKYYNRDKIKDDEIQYIMRDYGVYIDKDGTSQGFLRGGFNSSDSALAGPCSVSLHCDLGRSRSDCGFRPCV